MLPLGRELKGSSPTKKGVPVVPGTLTPDWNSYRTWWKSVSPAHSLAFSSDFHPVPASSSFIPSGGRGLRSFSPRSPMPAHTHTGSQPVASPGTGVNSEESFEDTFLRLEFHCGKSPQAPTADSSLELYPGNQFPRLYKLTCREAINMFAFVSMSISFSYSLI